MRSGWYPCIAVGPRAATPWSFDGGLRFGRPDRVSAAVRAEDPSTEGESETDTATLVRLARPWNVVAHDDPVTLMSYVIEVFREVFGYSETKARKLMLEVHNTGRSVVWTGDREQAEVYVTKLQARHVLATLERSEE